MTLRLFMALLAIYRMTINKGGGYLLLPSDREILSINYNYGNAWVLRGSPPIEMGKVQPFPLTRNAPKGCIYA